MPSEQDKIGDRINLPLMGVCVALMIVGTLITMTVALWFVGIPLLLIGVFGALGLYYSAKFRSKSSNLM